MMPIYLTALFSPISAGLASRSRDSDVGGHEPLILYDPRLSALRWVLIVLCVWQCLSAGHMRGVRKFRRRRMLYILTPRCLLSHPRANYTCKACFLVRVVTNAWLRQIRYFPLQPKVRMLQSFPTSAFPSTHLQSHHMSGAYPLVTASFTESYEGSASGVDEKK